jgi:hypothetical protein
MATNPMARRGEAREAPTLPLVCGGEVVEPWPDKAPAHQWLAGRVDEGEGHQVVLGMYSSSTGRWRGGGTTMNGGGGQRGSMGSWFDHGWEELGVATAEYGEAEGPFYRASSGGIWAVISGNGVSKCWLRKARKTGRRRWGGAISGG